MPVTVKKHSKTKMFRIFTEGATCDGRTIERAWIEQMAASYDPKVYGARVNLEHYRGITPDGPFKAYGDVTGLKAEEVDGKLCLFAQIDPTEELIALSKKRQKIYTSAEVQVNFADTGKAYLVGLAITDSPASLGTEMLQFSAQQGANSPLIARKQHKDNLFTAATEPLEIEFEEESTSLFASTVEGIKAKLALFSKAGSTNTAQITELAQAIDLAVDAFSAAQTEAQTAKFSLTEAVTALQTQLNNLETKFNALSKQLEEQPNQNYNPRQSATGGEGAILADC